MTTALIWILTPVLIIDSLLLGLLVLVQLPKKEAGIGMAFGSGATDALFGSGSGTALTKLTKYSAGIFFSLVLILSVLNVRAKNQSSDATMKDIQNAPAMKSPAVPSPAADTAPVPAVSNSAAGVAPTLQSLTLTNLPAAAGSVSNSPAK